MFEIGQTVRTHYEVTGLLETPPYGRWYGAVQSRTGMPVILWTIGAPFAPTREARQQLLERLVKCYEVRHPNYAQLADCFVEGDEVVAVLAVTSAPSIAAYLQRRRHEGTPVELGEARIILEHLCGAVGALHELGLVLGELRPDAVRITANGVAVVSVAAGTQSSAVELSNALRRAGAGHYLAPELHHGGRVGQEADVYSLGALAHLVIYGEPHGWPDGVKRGLFARMGRTLAYGGWRTRPAERHPAVDEVLRAALSGDAQQRPVNAEALFAMLERAIRNALLKSVLSAPAPVAAPPPPVAPQHPGASPFAGAAPSQRTMLADMSALPLTPVSAPPVQLAPSARTMMVDGAPPLFASAPAPAPAPSPAPQLFSMGNSGQLPPSAATMMVDPPAPLAPPRYAPPSAMHLEPEEATMMAEAPVLPSVTPMPVSEATTAPIAVAAAPPVAAPVVTTPSMPTMAMDARAPVVKDAPRGSLAVDIDLDAFEAVGSEKNVTREVDTKEIAHLLAKEVAPKDDQPDHEQRAPRVTSPSSSEQNKTREVDTKEIADLLARTRRDE